MGCRALDVDSLSLLDWWGWEGMAKCDLQRGLSVERVVGSPR